MAELFTGIWVSGEVSGLSRPPSGHLYFSLKDEESQLSTVLWKSAAERHKFRLEEGQKIVCRGNLDVYPQRGVYQLVVQQMEPLGLGELQLAFRQLQEKLAKEGLFAAEQKRPIPKFPLRVGLVTSPSGAAVRDFLEIAQRRWPVASVLIFPARVQGEGSVEDIVRAIAAANRAQPPLDLLVVGRGGGSLEDLWSFNTEAVVRAIHASKLPVVSAVGHEIDVTLADLVADLRALTPSEAAERIFPDRAQLLHRLTEAAQRLKTLLGLQTHLARQRLQALADRRILQFPAEVVAQLAQRVDELAARAQRAAREITLRSRTSLEQAGAQLHSLSPLAVLERGYSFTTSASGTAVRSVHELSPGDTLITRFADGEVEAKVETVRASTGEPLG